MATEIIKESHGETGILRLEETTIAMIAVEVRKGNIGLRNSNSTNRLVIRMTTTNVDERMTKVIGNPIYPK